MAFSFVEALSLVHGVAFGLGHKVFSITIRYDTARIDVVCCEPFCSADARRIFAEFDVEPSEGLAGLVLEAYVPALEATLALVVSGDGL